MVVGKVVEVPTPLVAGAEVSPDCDMDLINNPPHYQNKRWEVIDIILEWFSDNYLLGTVLKYLLRARFKGNYAQDLKKARWFLDREIAIAEERELVAKGGQQAREEDPASSP